MFNLRLVKTMIRKAYHCRGGSWPFSFQTDGDLICWNAYDEMDEEFAFRDWQIIR